MPSTSFHAGWELKPLGPLELSPSARGKYWVGYRSRANLEDQANLRTQPSAAIVDHAVFMNGQDPAAQHGGLRLHLLIGRCRSRD